MSLIKTSLKNDSNTWALYKRYRVNDTVLYSGITYQNTTGVNEEPTEVSVNWKVVNKPPAVLPVVTVNGNPFSLVKHPTNNAIANAAILEANDYVVNGFWDDTTFWAHAFFKGGDPDVIGNWSVTGKVSGLVLV